MGVVLAVHRRRFCLGYCRPTVHRGFCRRLNWRRKIHCQQHGSILRVDLAGWTLRV